MAVPKLRFNNMGFIDITTLGSVTELSGKKNKELGNYESYSINNIDGFVPQDEQFEGGNYSEADKSMYFIVSPGSFAYNPARINVGSIGYQNLDKDVIVSSLYEVFKTTDKCDAQYLWQFMHTRRFNDMVVKYAEGGVRQYLFYKNFCRIKVNLPSINEQKKIAEFLTTFDKRIAAQQNIIADLEETKKGLLQKIFSQEIRFKDDNGQDYPEWEEKRLGDISYVMRGLTYKPTDVRDDGIRVFRSSNISEDTFIYGEDDVFVDVNAVNIPFVQNGDILITAANGSSRLVGKHSVIHGVLNDTAVHGGFMLLIRSKDSAFINSSMYSSWYKKFVYKFVAGGNGAIGNLKKSDLENVHLFVPCEGEKKKITEFISTFDKKISAERQILSDLQEIKKGLLQQMFV